jgi:hypothetical protein
MKMDQCFLIQVNFANYSDSESDSSDASDSNVEETYPEEPQQQHSPKQSKECKVTTRPRRKWSLSNFMVRITTPQPGENGSPKNELRNSSEEEKEQKSKQFLGIFRKKPAAP